MTAAGVVAMLDERFAHLPVALAAAAGMRAQRNPFEDDDDERPIGDPDDDDGYGDDEEDDEDEDEDDGIDVV